MTPDHSVISSIELKQQLDRPGGALLSQAAVLPQANSIDAIAACMLARHSQSLFRQPIPVVLGVFSLSPAPKRLRMSHCREGDLTMASVMGEIDSTFTVESCFDGGRYRLARLCQALDHYSLPQTRT